MSEHVTTIVRIEKKQIGEAGEMFGKAFLHDPFYVYVLPDENKRLKALLWLFAAATRYGYLYGEAYTTSGPLAGAAIWLYSKQTMVRMIRAGMIRAPLELGVTGFTRLMKSLSLVEDLHEQAMPARHLYLMVLAVDPSQQGRGIGRMLLQTNLARADAEGLPCYLETTLPSNVPMYRKFGFDVVIEADFPNGGPRYWTMRRIPRAM